MVMEMVKRVKFIVGLIIFLFFVNYGYTFEVSGKVEKVVDGDTIHVYLYEDVIGVKKHKKGTVIVRLRGIDAPEKDQPFGQDAKRNLKNLVGGKEIKIVIRDIDRYGRIVGYVFVGKTNVNLEQVKLGFAWAYIEYLDRPYTSEFYEAEKNARIRKLGLWRESNPIPPWVWRKRR